MKFRELIRSIADRGDAVEALRVTRRLADRGLYVPSAGLVTFTYQDVMAFVERCGVDPCEWEELLYEAEGMPDGSANRERGAQ